MSRRKEPKVGISFQVTVEERELINKVASLSHDSVASWIRDMAKKLSKEVSHEKV